MRGTIFLDVAGLALAILAFKLSKSKPTQKYTYSREKASILISLLNAVILLISIGLLVMKQYSGLRILRRFQV